MAAEQRRLLTNPKGKLSKANVTAMLGKEEAWALLPQDTRQKLYAMLPPPQEGEPAYDIDVHPFNTHLEPYIKEEIERWQKDLQDGREAKSWREKAIQAGKDRADGKWDEWKQQQREQDWGKPEEEEEVKQHEDECGAHDLAMDTNN